MGWLLVTAVCLIPLSGLTSTTWLFGINAPVASLTAPAMRPPVCAVMNCGEIAQVKRKAIKALRRRGCGKLCAPLTTVSSLLKGDMMVSPRRVGHTSSVLGGAAVRLASESFACVCLLRRHSVVTELVQEALAVSGEPLLRAESIMRCRAQRGIAAGLRRIRRLTRNWVVHCVSLPV